MPSRWEFRYRLPLADGRRAQQRVVIGTVAEYPTLEAARAKVGELLLKINAGVARPARHTLGEVTNRFIEEEHLRSDGSRGATERALHFATAKGYLTVLERYLRPRWGETELTAVRAGAVQAWLDSLTLAPKTKAHIRGLFKRLLESAMLWDMLDVARNPIELVKVKGSSKRRKLPTVLTAAEFQAVVGRLRDPCRTMVIVAQCTGLRVSEILALQWRDFDFAHLSFTVTRGVVHGRIDDVKSEYSHDLLPLAPPLAQILKAWREVAYPTPEGWVFANPVTGRPYHASSLAKRHLRPVGQALGRPLGWHTFRHTYRSWLDAVGAPVGVQQKLMRHAQISTTMNTYGNALMASKRDANNKVVGLALMAGAVHAQDRNVEMCD
jgi:integrase